tara:strand:- start:387 stop:560 length:174 start_codon:yes stop_codon:yes gene_type:complete
MVMVNYVDAKYEMLGMGFSLKQIVGMVKSIQIENIDDKGNVYLNYSKYDGWVNENKN